MFVCSGDVIPWFMVQVVFIECSSTTTMEMLGRRFFSAFLRVIRAIRVHAVVFDPQG